MSERIMPNVKNLEILSRLGQRARLRDLTYFVGRTVERNTFAWSPRSGSSSRVFWLHGPPRVGKSSLAHAVGQDVASEGGKVIWADLIDAPSDFQGALAVVVNAATQAGVTVPQGSTPAQRIERLVSKQDRQPLLFIIDECDRVAVQMSTDEQAFLRRLVETVDRLSFFFVSRVDPNRIVEQVVEARSRLLPIATIRYLGALSQSDVAALFRSIARNLCCSLFEDASHVVWERVGGHPLCVMALAHDLVARIEHLHGLEDLVEAVEDARESIDPLLQLLWPELRHRTRISLLAKSPAELGKLHEQDAMADGYFGKMPSRGYIRPTWLVAQGERLGVMPSAYPPQQHGTTAGEALGLCQRIYDLLFEINRRAKMNHGGQPWFEATDEWLRFHVASRAVVDDRSFREVLEHLYKTLYLAARTNSPSDWRIPADVRVCYTNSVGLISLSELRNLIQSRPDQHRHEMATYFCRIIGKDVPTQPFEWSMVRDTLLRELSEALQLLLAAAGGSVLTREQGVGLISIAAPKTTTNAPSVPASSPLAGTDSTATPCAVDVGIVTIKNEELQAVLDAFPEEAGRTVGRSGRHYNLRWAAAGGGARYRVAIVRQLEQGTGEAQDVARDMIDELEPALILVVGIAGGRPSDEITLGDVVLSLRVNDYTLRQEKFEVQAEYAIAGGVTSRHIAGGVVNLSARKPDLGAWTDSLPPRPLLNLDDIETFGPLDWQSEIRRTLRRHFLEAPRTEPSFFAGVIGSSDALVKDPTVVIQWLTTARNLLAVEMEAAGVYRAARERTSILAIRGISDIVGLKRDERWTRYACASAAAFARAYLRTTPIRISIGSEASPRLKNEQST
jgi:nucleoside phosphorylase